MNRIYELLDKKFLTEDEAIELEEKLSNLGGNNKVIIEYYGMSKFYMGYSWQTITINGVEYYIYVK